MGRKGRGRGGEGKEGRGRGGEGEGGVRREERVHCMREIWSTSHTVVCATIKRNAVAVNMWHMSLSTHY